jgi:hypothetical protein
MERVVMGNMVRGGRRNRISTNVIDCSLLMKLACLPPYLTGKSLDMVLPGTVASI